MQGTSAFCPAPSSGMNQDSSFHSCCACLVSAALTTASQSPLCSLLPASCLACVKEHRVALRVSQLVPGCPWSCAAPGLACPSLSLQRTLTSLLLMQLAASAVQKAWLGCTSLTAQGFGCLGFFPLKAVCINKSVVFKRYCPQTQTAPMPPP